jgi:hypothetical protein
MALKPATVAARPVAAPQMAAAPVAAPAPAPQEDEVDISQVSMMDLAGVDMSGIEEVRATTFPAGIFDWEITELEEETGENKEGVKQFKMLVHCQCVNVISVASLGVDPTTIPGQKFTHRITKNIETKNDLYTFLGMVKAFLGDVGVNTAQSYPDMLASAVGKQFRCVVVHKPNKDDKDSPYANFNTKKLSPLS